MKKLIFVLFAMILLASCTKHSEYELVSKVPDLKMPDNGLAFKEIENYMNYKIVSTHFRTDKNELRYVLADEKAYKSFVAGQPFPNGSKIVKIGWKVEEMPNFSPALEAKEIQRVEYMIKDDKKFADVPGNWGYARFVKKDGKYESWNEGTISCVACHNLAKNNGYVFSKFQSLQ